MPSTCEFHINSPNGVYYSGQQIVGTINLRTTSEKSIRAVRMRFLGEAKVHWTETEQHRKHDGKYETRTIHYRGNEVYVDNTTTVRGEGKLPPGTHTYNFNIPLPMSCPTSCEGAHGNIRYALWLIVDRPFRFDNEFNKPLTVLRTVDLNLNPAFKVPIHAEEISSIGCWPCANGQIMYNLRVPFGAYAPGQTIPYALDIQNQSMTDITGYSVEFQERTTFTAHTPRHKSREKKTVFGHREHNDSCLRLSNRRFEGSLVLPSLPPDTESYGIIRVQHLMALEITVSGCHSNNKLKVPICIGTVPIRESMQIMPQAPPSELPTSNGYSDVALATSSGFGGVEPSAPALPPSTPLLPNGEKDCPPSYADLKPPSFEEAIRSHSPFQDPDANEHNSNIGFRPLYPMYPQSNEKQ